MINQRATKQRRINPAYGRCTVIDYRTSPVHRASFSSPDVYVRAFMADLQLK